MANINYRRGRWGMVRRLARYLAEGLIYSGSAWLLLPLPPPAYEGPAQDEGVRDELAQGDAALPAGHPERLVPHVAPTGAERLLWRQLEDEPR